MGESSKKGSILIVDDNKINLQVIGGVLAPEKYKLAFALNADQAKSYLSRSKPDLILLDIMMPGTNGIELCQQLKQDDELKDIPIIFVTAKTEQADLVEAFNAGGVDYITKPFIDTELKSRVATHIALKTTQDKLITALDTKDRLMSIIAHDLRGPLGSLVSLLHILQNNSSNFSEEQQQETMSILGATADGAFALLENLLEWSRSQMGSIQVYKAECFIDEIIKGAIAPLASMLSNKKIMLNTEGIDHISVFCDPKLMSTIFRNLVSNAIKFTPQSGKISINTEVTDHECIISVKDTGIGMTPETVELILDLNSHYTTSGTQSEKGTGLGISLCVEFAEKNGGKFWIESKPNNGSSFFVSVPLATKQE